MKCSGGDGARDMKRRKMQQSYDDYYEKGLLELLKHLDARSLAMAFCVSKRWGKTAWDERLWKLICTEQWSSTGSAAQELQSLVAQGSGYRSLYSRLIWPCSSQSDIYEYLCKLEVVGTLSFVLQVEVDLH
ncbi:F-box protein GID2-like [Gastrolobium bilobum]|uniref:F-box protein GID2-like n=1 Tax=Gastrolobium bilobum TaxID=150636 RepID=UPI002AB1ED62|nr:F-box protein GID2-like [Gastrolobium bilobum]